MQEANIQALELATVPAHAVIPLREDVAAEAQRAMNDGRISVRFQEDGEAANWGYMMQLEPTDLPEGFTIEQARGTDRTMAALPFNEPAEVADRTMTAINEGIVDEAVKGEWYAADPAIQELVEDGSISEQFALEIAVKDGAGSARVINFSETPLTNEHQAQILHVAERVTALTGMKLLDVLNAICIIPADRMDETTYGTARLATGVIGLNERLLQENGFPDKADKFPTLRKTKLEETLTHEFAHLIERTDPLKSEYRLATGWSTTAEVFTDDYGDVRSAYMTRLGHVPVHAMINGASVHIRSRYGDKTADTAKPVTDYGRTNGGEDLAEAFVPFVHDPDSGTDKQLLDPLRRDLIASMIDRVVGDEDTDTTVSLNALPVDTPLVESIHIEPRDIILSEPKYNVPAPKPDFSDSRKIYQYGYKTIIDDFGNEIQVQSREPRKIIF